jgi:ornithine--oxo-acid transaminase
MLSTGEFQQRSAVLGERLHTGLSKLVGNGVDAVRSRGLWAGVDVDPGLMTGREFCEALLERGVLAKEAHGQTVRLAPPLVATEADVDLLVEAFAAVVG